jgi:hypothetical protein
MVYKGIVKGKVVVLEEEMTLPEDTPVEVVPVQAPLTLTLTVYRDCPKKTDWPET